ncbi:MAG TPA: SH3 domain-containing protein [Pyrinomonadaceae bacterium]|nr:SH3 domain-containing protein [Pyrinomonadaceae bacterium]
MLRFTRELPRQYVVLPIAFFIFFALFLTADSVESAQTGRNAAKTKTTPAKKNAKATPTPNKKTQAKATPTPKNSRDKKGKTNSSAKSDARGDSKNKAAQEKSGRQPSPKTNQKTSAAKQTKDSKNKDSKSKDSNSGQNAKNRKDDSRQQQQNAKNTKSNNSKSDKSKNKSDSNRTSSSNSGTNSRNTSAGTSDGNRRTEPANRNTSGKSNASTNRTTPKTGTEISTELPQIIVTDVSARLRSQAQPNAPELSRIRLGTILKVTEKNPAWYRVQYTAGGKTANGWISANSVNDLNAGAREELYRQIVDRNYKAEMDFAAASEMVDFLTQVGSELSGKSNAAAAAELELKRLLALRTALKKIPGSQGDRSPYREFLKAHEKSVIYSDPAAEWYVVSNLFWDLHKKYAATPLADQIAWEGAENPLPGECEGYVNCYLFSERMTNGEYLRLHPNGKKAGAALAELTRFLSSVVDDLEKRTSFTGPTDVTDRADFNNLLAELRTIVSRLPHIEKEKTLQQLKQIAEAYR